MSLEFDIFQSNELESPKDSYNVNHNNNIDDVESVEGEVKLNTPDKLHSLCLLSMKSLFNVHLSAFIEYLDNADTVINLSDFVLEPHHASVLTYQVHLE